jgi:hypothetical protein
VAIGLADEVGIHMRNQSAGRVASDTSRDDKPKPMAIPALADHAGYQRPMPNLAGLLEKKKVQFGGTDNA